MTKSSAKDRVMEAMQQMNTRKNGGFVSIGKIVHKTKEFSLKGMRLKQALEKLVDENYLTMGDKVGSQTTYKIVK